MFLIMNTSQEMSVRLFPLACPCYTQCNYTSKEDNRYASNSIQSVQTRAKDFMIPSNLFKPNLI